MLHVQDTITIREVARAAGVSITTVSRVFNQGHLVKNETRKRVMEHADRLQYVPNTAARNLIVRRKNILGVIVPFPHSEYFIEMLAGMDEVAQRYGFLLMITGSHHRSEDMRVAYGSMKGQVDGFLVVAPNAPVETWQDVVPPEVPSVFLNSPDLGRRYRSVRLMNREGGFRATQHLIGLGHERIAVIAGPDVNSESQERLDGYRAALLEAGIMPDPALLFKGNFMRDTGAEAAQAILALCERPTAIFAFNDLMAIGAMSVLNHRGVRVPEDIALMGFDDIPMAQYVQPTLSTVSVPIRSMGARAVEYLVRLLNEEEEAVEVPALVQTRIVPRASTLGRAFHGVTEHQFLS